METRANHILIGLFVLLAFVCALLFVLWLNKSNGSDGDARAYRIIFNESVQGLSQGSPVQYNGIPVGSVTALSLSPERPNQVVARILVHGTTPIREDTTATLAMQGLAGRSIIQLRGGRDDSPVLLAPAGQDPVIIARPSTVGQIIDQGEQTLANLNALTLSAQQLFSPDNLASVHATLANAAQLSSTLATQSQDIAALLGEMRTATRQFHQTFADMNTLVKTVNTALDGRAARITTHLDESAATLARLLHDSKVPLARTLQGASTIGSTLAELRATLAALRTTLERLNADPAGYLLNRNPLPEFRP